MRFFQQLPEQRAAWALLAATAFGLFATALYMQYGMGLEPCVKCIYQRVAILAIGVAALVPLIAPKLAIARLLGFAGWLVAAIWGFIIANEHVATQQAANSFFAVCDTFPNFPKWLPLHQWFPGLFSSTGLCGDINWQFAGLSMPQWMRIIFASYAVVGILVLVLRLLGARRI
ncbi:disulfide bond formation protein DsbB [Pseudidiomarina insulisalsae]|uniref:Disulfide bond formation protein B n=1 Tax=Pseudidiomarina insulisalsae TaxID=575789 RepID=A0A432YF17_9GAMM|nr:disulfide bond formation protein DsbB [Pseudidiomarina insulisalsae]RUO59534.1 disulfide bond formation protein DsbB [Pseudidiomarina insulisalsae]